MHSPAALGVPPHVVREIAGHSDIKVTVMVYAHGNSTERLPRWPSLVRSFQSNGAIASPSTDR